MQTLRDVLQRAQQRGAAVGHFNISDFVLLKAVFDAAQEVRVPVIVGASEGEHGSSPDRSSGEEFARGI